MCLHFIQVSLLFNDACHRLMVMIRAEKDIFVLFFHPVLFLLFGFDLGIGFSPLLCYDG